MTDKTTEKTPHINQYDGPDDSSSLERTIADVQKEWSRFTEKDFIGSLDDLLVQQIQHAIQRHQKKVTLLDIGSGPKAVLLQEVTQKPALLPNTQALLIKHPEISIECTGITDAETKEDFLRQDPLTLPESQNDQIKAQNIRFSITASQTLEQALQKFEIGSLDLVLATFFLTYLGPKAFEQTLRTVIERLSPGAKMVVTAYAEDHPAIQRNEMAFLQLKTRNAHDKFGTLSPYAFDHKFYVENMSYQELMPQVNNAERFLEKIGLQDPSFLAKLKRNSSNFFEALSWIIFEHKRGKHVDLERFKVRFMLEKQKKNVNRPIWDLERRLRVLMRKKKKQILDQLMSEYPNVILRYNDQIITIEKPISSP